VTLLCTVRGCALPLGREGRVARCPAGHAYDRAREGYWNLLQPQDRRSSRAGDTLDAALARRRWLERGFASGLIEAIRALLPSEGTALDVACGEGSLTRAVLPGGGVAGIDLSVPSIRLAARSFPEATWVVANADRGLPLADGSVDVAVSLFGRRPFAELRRVVRPAGIVLVAIPAEDDLIELREAAQGEAVRRDRVEGVLAETAGAFTLARRETWRSRAHHDRAALEDALAMSYRGSRRSERARLEGVESLDVTAAAELLILAPS
jgi:23S rRNA (guanine745-N1)-methyltransferase